MKNQTNESLAFPILCILPESAIELTKTDFIELYHKGFSASGCHLLKNGCSPKLAISAIIDRNGCWRTATVVSKRRKWAEYVWWVWDWVLTEYEFRPAEALRSSEMLDRLKEVKAKPPFAKAGNLRGMLKRLPPDTIFDAKLFREFWDKHCPKLQPHEWEEELP